MGGIQSETDFFFNYTFLNIPKSLLQKCVCGWSSEQVQASVACQLAATSASVSNLVSMFLYFCIKKKHPVSYTVLCLYLIWINHLNIYFSFTLYPATGVPLPPRGYNGVGRGSLEIWQSVFRVGSTYFWVAKFNDTICQNTLQRYLLLTLFIFLYIYGRHEDKIVIRYIYLKN